MLTLSYSHPYWVITKGECNRTFTWDNKGSTVYNGIYLAVFFKTYIVSIHWLIIFS